jgi:hypothetical protein
MNATQKLVLGMAALELSVFSALWYWFTHYGWNFTYNLYPPMIVMVAIGAVFMVYGLHAALTDDGTE